jgi:hypothetical protein
LFACLFSNAAMGFGIKIIIRHEGNDEGDLKIKLGLLASVTIYIYFSL